MSGSANSPVAALVPTASCSPTPIDPSGHAVQAACFDATTTVKGQYVLTCEPGFSTSPPAGLAELARPAEHAGHWWSHTTPGAGAERTRTGCAGSPAVAGELMPVRIVLRRLTRSGTEPARPPRRAWDCVEQSPVRSISEWWVLPLVLHESEVLPCSSPADGGHD